MLLAAALHTIGNMTPPKDPARLALENAMRGFRFSLGMGMNPSMFDIHMVLVLTMTVTYAGFGVLNLVLAGAPELPGRLLRRVMGVNLLWVGASIVLCWFYRVPPPLISCIVIALPLVAALLTRTDKAGD